MTDGVAVQRQHGVPIPRNAALHHLQAHDSALRAAGRLHGLQCLAPQELALIQLQPAVEPGFKDVHLF